LRWGHCSGIASLDKYAETNRIVTLKSNNHSIAMLSEEHPDGASTVDAGIRQASGTG